MELVEAVCTPDLHVLFHAVCEAEDTTTLPDVNDEFKSRHGNANDKLLRLITSGEGYPH